MYGKMYGSKKKKASKPKAKKEKEKEIIKLCT